MHLKFKLIFLCNYNSNSPHQRLNRKFSGPSGPPEFEKNKKFVLFVAISIAPKGHITGFNYHIFSMFQKGVPYNRSHDSLFWNLNIQNFTSGGLFGSRMMDFFLESVSWHSMNVKSLPILASLYFETHYYRRHSFLQVRNRDVSTFWGLLD